MTTIQDLEVRAAAGRKPAKPMTPTNGNGKMLLPSVVNPNLSPILRPQAAYRWLLPSLAAITPQYIETVLRGALAGSHVQEWELFKLMLDSWPELGSVVEELVEGVLRKKLIFEPWREDEQEPTPRAMEKCKLVSSALRRMRPDPANDENDLNGTLRDIIFARLFGLNVLAIKWAVITPKTKRQTALQGSEALHAADNDQPFIAPISTYWIHPVCYARNMEGRLGLRLELAGLQNQNKALKQANGASSMSGLTTSVWNSTTYQPRPTDIQPFPPHAFIIAEHKAVSGPALGSALLRSLAWWWCAANFSADWLLNYAQLFGLPFRWANYPQGTPQETIDAICAMLQNMGSAAYAAFPEGAKIEFKDASKSGDAMPQGDLLDRADRYARTRILGQTMTGQDSSTGKGFGEQEGNVKSDRFDAVAKACAGVLNSQLIPDILALNYGEGETDECPQARFLEENEGTGADAARDVALAQGGLKIGLSYLYKKYNIPPPQDGEETIGGPPPTPVMAPPGQQPINKAKEKGEELEKEEPNKKEAKQEEREEKQEEIESRLIVLADSLEAASKLPVEQRSDALAEWRKERDKMLTELEAGNQN